MATIIQNLNSIITTKNELNSILQENGVDGGEIFSEYPQKFRSVIASGGGSDKVSYSYLEEKLSDYVSYSYLESKHYLDSIPNTYATYEAISGMGYLTSIPNDYPTYAAISEMSYATQSYVVDYVAEHGGGGSTTIDENIIPKENNTYTLGSDSYQYVSTYTYWVGAYNSGTTIDNAHGVKIIINGNDRFYYANSQFRPLTDNYCNLGLSTAQWKSTYTYNLYSPSLVLSYSYNSIDNASNTQINFKINGWNRAKLTNTTFCPSTNNGIKLGDSGAQWSSSYVRDLYLDGTNIKTAINGMFSYDSTTGTLTITTLS